MRVKNRGIRTINLALQGGGAHGAFTWGVLDRLLEDQRLDFEGISGTSSGAMNAVVLAQGLTEAGRQGARDALRRFWERVALELPFDTINGTILEAGNAGHDPPPGLLAYIGLTRFLSPYQLNPFDLNPLRDIVTEMIDFERLRRECVLQLFINATQVRTGKTRIFHARELTPDTLLASACLPSLHHAVEIDGEAYWDGGFTGNPAVFPLIFDCRGEDIVVVMLHPLSRPELPDTMNTIWERMAELSFSASFLREMRAIAFTQGQVERDIFPLGRIEKRFRRLHFHLIEGEELMVQLSHSSRLNTRLPFLEMLWEQGRSHADAWLHENFRHLGKCASVDLQQLFC